MQIRRLSPDEFNRWNEFCRESPEAWFWHTTDWIEYFLSWSQSLPNIMAFMLEENGRILGIFPLIHEENLFNGESAREITRESFFAPALAGGLSEHVRHKVMKMGLGEVDRICSKNNFLRSTWHYCPLSPSYFESYHFRYNPLARFGYIDISRFSQIIDLSKSEEELFRGFSKGNRAAAKAGEKLFETAVYSKANMADHAFDAYIQMHKKAAKRLTRPQVTFEMMRQWCATGKAALFCALRGGAYAGFGLVLMYKNGAYYASACNDPEHRTLPVGNTLQWVIIRWLKAKGFRWYEVGDPCWYVAPHILPSEKLKNIGIFKRGFGGIPVTSYVGERYYSKRFFLEVAKKRGKEYADTIFCRHDLVDGCQVDS
jgi:hypothetical protein